MVLNRPVAQRDEIRIQSLTTSLIREWQEPHAEHEPLIIEETGSSGGTLRHVYVVWSEWEDLSPLERSRIILRATEQVRGMEAAVDVTVAMGLIPQEAKTLGIEMS